MKRIPKLFRILFAVAFWIFVWWAAAKSVGSELLFPAPAAVFRVLWALVQSKEFYLVTGRSLLNVVTGILAAVALGVLLAGLCHRVRILRDLFLPLMTIIKATPVASFIVLLPVSYTHLTLPTMDRIDPGLSEVARVYRFSYPRRLRVLVLPSLRPYFLSACRTSLGLAWKAGIAAEILATPRGTIGRMIGDARLYLETEQMFAWTLTVILLSLLIEYGFVALFRRFDRSARAGGDRNA